MQRRVFLSPLQLGSRTPEEFEAAVKAALAEPEALTPPEPRPRLHRMRKPTILEPVMRSPRRAALEAAVDKAIARRAESAKAEATKTGKSAPRKNAAKPAPKGE